MFENIAYAWKKNNPFPLLNTSNICLSEKSENTEKMKRQISKLSYSFIGIHDYFDFIDE